MASHDDDVRTQAAAWFARLRAPDGAKDRTAFEAWRHADPQHGAAYDRMDERWRRDAVLSESRLSDTWQLQPSFWHRTGIDRPRVWLPAAAAIALVMVGGLWGSQLLLPAGSPPPSYASSVGTIRTIALPDGSRLTLDTASSVSLLFTAGERAIRLDRGRARFDVRHDAARPFVVLAGGTRITDKGTIFDVRLRDRGVEVALLRGRVEIGSTVVAKPFSRVTLVPGERVVVNSDAARAVTRTIDHAVPAWVTGMLAFDDAPLVDMLREVNRYGTRHIVLGDPRLARARVTGAFRATAPDDVARTLASLFQLDVVSDPQGNLVLLPGTAAPATGAAP